MTSASTTSNASAHDADDTWQDEDDETRQDFNEFKIWLEQQGDVPKVVSPRRTKVSQAPPPACSLCKKVMGDCILPELGLITFQKKTTI